jgi:hypothetical protein
VSPESSTQDSDHSNAHDHVHHAAGATFVDPLGSTAIEPVKDLHEDNLEPVDVLESNGVSTQGSLISLDQGSEDVPNQVDLVNTSQDVALSLVAPQNTKVTPDNADQWIEGIKVRMDKLREDVNELNARLDRFKRPVIK